MFLNCQHKNQKKEKEETPTKARKQKRGGKIKIS